MFRRIAWIVARLLYRLKVVGRQHFPVNGPALIVSNHVSYVDWLVIMGASPRPVRFVIASNFARNPFFGWILRLAKVIPIERDGGPKSLVRTLLAIREAFDAGDIVCMFPEGYPTRTGIMLPFHRGFQKVAERAGTPIIPTYLDQLWGSIFSYKGGRLFWKWPSRPAGPVTVTFGSPVSADLSAPQVRQVLVQISAERAKERSKRLLPLHRQFVRSASRHPFRPCLIDTTGAKPRILNRGKVLAGAVCFSRWLRPKLGDDTMVGIWLPQSAGSAVANIALCLLHKSAVNLNYTSGDENVRSAARQCGLRHILTSKRFLHRVPLDLGPDVNVIHLEDAVAGIPGGQRFAPSSPPCCCPAGCWIAYSGSEVTRATTWRR